MNEDGAEHLYTTLIEQPVANFGVSILSQARGTSVQPRIVAAGDENRLVGFTSLPLDQNPYRALFGDIVPIVGAIRPAAGSYDIVFDTPRRRAEGRFRFRFWIGDVTPPSIRLLTKSIRRGGRLLVRVSDRGSGVDRRTLAVTIDGGGRSTFSYRSSLLVLGTGGLGRGRHTLRVVAADRQEAKNMENTGPILPNTRTMRAAFRVR
jgi:hypothetical protein